MVHKTRIRSKQKPPTSAGCVGLGEKNCLGVKLMYNESVLKPRVRVHFDPSNKDHIEDYANFIKNANWKIGCKYLLEQPFQDIPSMINNKLIAHFLKPHLNV